MDLEDEDSVVSVALVEREEELVASPPQPSTEPSVAPSEAEPPGEPEGQEE
jgi:hypothetical protein